METNERIEQQRIVTDSPGERREVITESTQVGRAGPQEFKLSAGTIGLIAVLAVVVIGIAVYVVNNKNENEAANRETASQMSREQVPPTVIQQPAVVPPVIIQQPAQSAPVIIQQPAQPSGDALMDDAALQRLATSWLADEPSLSAVTATVSAGRVVLSGTVNSAASKAKAEQVVKAVRGVKSVDNQLVVSP